MRFINIESKHNGPVAINANAISSLQMGHDVVYIYLSGDKPIATQFTDIAHAIDYIQRASSISLTQGV